MPGSRKTRPSWPFTCLLLLVAAAFAAGCSTANTTGGGGTSAKHVLPSGGSVPGWTIPTGGSQHAISATQEYASSGTLVSCTDCHSSDLQGGISRTSCFGNPAGCHHGTIAGWVTPQVHGVWAKRAPGDGSFFSCQICHGRDFSSGGAQIACSTCHGVDAPHPPKPWLSGTGFTHTDTNPLNAPVCSLCHFPGSPNNPAGHPATPAPAGTPPGCFNSTLCHGAVGAPHPLGNPAWETTPPAAQPHGNAGKAAPGATTGFAYCQICHGAGTDFAGGFSVISCYPCHGGSSPHPAQWRTGDTYVHTSTAEGNATVCVFCHLNGANSPIAPPSPPAPAGTAPGCFNSTLCHATAVPHPVGNAWVTTPPAAQPHGNAGKAAPGATTGLAYCQTCHGTGTGFAGGSSEISCYPCHGGSSPHPAQWRTGGTYVHTSTAEGNATVCAFCHLNGANSPIAPPTSPAPAGTAPGCFNSTLCHGATFHPTGWDQATQHGPVAKQAPSASGGFAFCQVCHGTGANFSGGASGTSCYTCHGVSAPHPSGATWVNSTTPTHRTTDPGNAAVCALCHQSNPGTPGCFNNTLCHGS
jgi:hypothetical protein